MRVIDMHCDTVGEMRLLEKAGAKVSLRQNNLSVDLEKMRKGGYSLQTFAMFVDRKEEGDAFGAAREILHIFRREMEENKDIISQITSFAELEENEKTGKMSALLSIEEGAVYQESKEQLQWFYEQGARMATLTWNYENDLAYPNRAGNPLEETVWSTGEERGLKEKGIEYLEEMERLHIIVDVSHLSDGGFRDVARYSKRPFIASHSNARGLAKAAARNLTNDMIHTLAERGGVMGLNYCVAFMRPDWKPGEEGTTMDEIVEMARYILNTGGSECLGLGSDFDGIEERPQMYDCSRMQELAERMAARLGSTQTDKIFSGNVRRFLKENL